MEFIKIILAYTLTGVFIFTALITSLSLTGWIKFADKKQQQILFKALILELTIVAVGFFAKLLEFDTTATKDKIVVNALTDKRKDFTDKLKAARSEYDNGNLPKAYSMVGELFKSDELREYLPIRDLFILNGDISSRREFWLEAVESYGPALKLDPDNVEVIVNSGYAQRQLKNYEIAEKLYDRAMLTQSQNWEVLNGYFNCLRRYAAFLNDEHPKIAEQKFQKAAEIVKLMKNISTNPEQQQKTDIAKGTLYWEWEKYDVAYATYKKLINDYPGESRFEEDFAALSLEMGKLDEAKNLFAKLYEKEKLSKKLGWYIGSGYAEAASKAGANNIELNFALEAGLIAISNKPDEPFPYYAVAMVYKNLGQKKDCLKYLHMADEKETERETNIHTYDKKRHNLYKKLLKELSV